MIEKYFNIYLIGLVLCIISWSFYFKIVKGEVTIRNVIFLVVSSLFSYGGLLWSFVYWFLYLMDPKGNWGNKKLW